MKKLLIATLIAASATLVTEAAKGDSTKEQYMANQKANAEAQGKTFDVRKAEKMFEQMDTNGDGIASGDEKKAYWGKGSTPAAPQKRVPQKGDSTKEQYMENQRKNAEKKGMTFDEKKAEKMFEQLDTNGDGIASAEEKKAYWGK